MKEPKIKNILVVDDSHLITTMFKDELNTMGYTAYVANSIEDADKILHNKEIDMMFLDMHLPGMNGIDYITKPQRRNNKIIIVIMTAYESVKTAIEAIDRGAYDYVIKPVAPHHIEILIKRAQKTFEIREKNLDTIRKDENTIEQYKSKLIELEIKIKDLKTEVNSLLTLTGEPKKYK